MSRCVSFNLGADGVSTNYDGAATGLVAVLETAIRELVRQEVQVAVQALLKGGTPAMADSRWTTPPKAARASGVPVKSIRRMARDGRITPRFRNTDSNPRQPKYLVNLDEVEEAAGRVSRPAHSVSAPETIADRAARIRAKGEER